MTVTLETARQEFLKVSDAYNEAIKTIEDEIKTMRKGTTTIAHYNAALKKLKRDRQRFVKSVGL